MAAVQARLNELHASIESMKVAGYETLRKRVMQPDSTPGEIAAHLQADDVVLVERVMTSMQHEGYIHGRMQRSVGSARPMAGAFPSGSMLQVCRDFGRKRRNHSPSSGLVRWGRPVGWRVSVRPTLRC